MTSGRKTSQDVKESIQLGAIDYIIKPIDKTIFQNKIKNLWKIDDNWYEYPVLINNDEINLTIKSNLKLLTINEIGISFFGPIDLFKLNESVQIDIEFLKKNGLIKNFFKVKEIKTDHDQSLFHLSFIGLEEFDRKIIRLICRNLHISSQNEKELKIIK